MITPPPYSRVNRDWESEAHPASRNSLGWAPRPILRRLELRDKALRAGRTGFRADPGPGWLEGPRPWPGNEGAGLAPAGLARRLSFPCAWGKRTPPAEWPSCALWHGPQTVTVSNLRKLREGRGRRKPLLPSVKRLFQNRLGSPWSFGAAPGGRRDMPAEACPWALLDGRPPGCVALGTGFNVKAQVVTAQRTGHSGAPWPVVNPAGPLSRWGQLGGLEGWEHVAAPSLCTWLLCPQRSLAQGITGCLPQSEAWARARDPELPPRAPRWGGRV